MSKKTLKEKITSVCWWTLGLSVAYFAIGAYLKSDGPKFDPEKTYELIRDTLTLTAAFLAPVAAFVLFTDWRHQHNAIKNENLSEEVIKIIKDDFGLFYKLTKDDLKDTSKYNEYRVSFFNLIQNLTNKINLIQGLNRESIDFKTEVKSTIQSLYSLWDNLSQQSFASYQYESIALMDGAFIKEKQQILIEMLSTKLVENQKIYEEIQEKIKKLKPLSV